MTTSIFHKINNWLNRPFPIMENPQMKWLIIIFHGAFVAFFLTTFQPFDAFFIEGSRWITGGFGLIVSLILIFFEIIVQPLIKLNIKNWTLKKSILWSFFEMLTIIVAFFLYKNFWTNFENFNFGELLNIAGITAIIAIIPVIFITILLENWLLKDNLKKAALLQKTVETNIQSTPPPINSNNKIIKLHAENQQLALKIDIEKLILIESSDNYVTVYYLKNNLLKKSLIRSSLKSIEEQISQDNILRCHRSFIVNLNKVTKVDGNSRGLLLHFDYIDQAAPVSRRYVKAILAELTKLEIG